MAEDGEEGGLVWGPRHPELVVGPILGRGAFGVVRLGAALSPAAANAAADSVATGVDEAEVGAAHAVALKDIPLTAWASVCREALAMVRCNGHPNIVRLLGVQHLHADPCSPLERARLVMEYAAGGTLASIAREWRTACGGGGGHGDDAEVEGGGGAIGGGAAALAAAGGNGMPEALARKYMRDLIEAVAYVHSVGVVHGDIKGANVLVAADGRALLADFGSAFVAGTETVAERATLAALVPTDLTPGSSSSTAADAVTRTPGGDFRLDALWGAAAAATGGGGGGGGGGDGKGGGGKAAPKERGTLRWTAPEVLRGGLGSAASASNVALLQAGDVWACGCTALELLTGSPPWWWLAPDSGEITVHLVSTDVRTALPPWLSPMARDFLSTALHPEPRARPTAPQLLAHPFLRDAPPRLAPIPLSLPFVPPCARTLTLATPRSPPAAGALHDAAAGVRHIATVSRLGCRQAARRATTLLDARGAARPPTLPHACTDTGGGAAALAQQWELWAPSLLAAGAPLPVAQYAAVTLALRRLRGTASLYVPHVDECGAVLFGPPRGPRPPLDAFLMSPTALLLLRAVCRVLALFGPVADGGDSGGGGDGGGDGNGGDGGGKQEDESDSKAEAAEGDAGNSADGCGGGGGGGDDGAGDTTCSLSGLETAALVAFATSVVHGRVAQWLPLQQPPPDDRTTAYACCTRPSRASVPALLTLFAWAGAARCHMLAPAGSRVVSDDAWGAAPLAAAFCRLHVWAYELDSMLDAMARITAYGYQLHPGVAAAVVDAADALQSAWFHLAPAVGVSAHPLPPPPPPPPPAESKHDGGADDDDEDYEEREAAIAAATDAILQPHPAMGVTSAAVQGAAQDTAAAALLPWMAAQCYRSTNLWLATADFDPASSSAMDGCLPLERHDFVHVTQVHDSGWWSVRKVPQSAALVWKALLSPGRTPAMSASERAGFAVGRGGSGGAASDADGGGADYLEGWVPASFLRHINVDRTDLAALL